MTTATATELELKVLAPSGFMDDDAAGDSNDEPTDEELDEDEEDAEEDKDEEAA